MHDIKTKRAALLSAALIAAAAATFLTGCSSAPKRPAEIFTNRNSAMAQLALGNKAVSKGDFANARLYLAEAWRLAVSTDDPVTRISVLLAQGNERFNEGDGEKAGELWKQAETEASNADDKSLLSVAKIYMARGTLAEGTTNENVADTERKRRASAAKAVVLAEIDGTKDNDLYHAFALKVLGLSEKELGNAKAAEEAIKKAAELHEKGKYLEDTAYDWYLIASVRSKAGKYQDAEAALETAISFDRRAENANGLAMDWMAIGMINVKAGKPGAAITAYTRAKEIFLSAYLKDSAANADKKIAELQQQAAPK
jgi:tetratricopeptide (TPR) repeat protein